MTCWIRSRRTGGNCFEPRHQPHAESFAVEASSRFRLMVVRFFRRITMAFHTFGSGFSLGFDVGLQVPIAPSQVTFKSQVNLLADPQIPEATRQQLNNQYVKPTDDQVRGTLENIGRSIIPTFNVRIGWLIARRIWPLLHSV